MLSHSTSTVVGRVVGLWRYPVKSITSDGKVASAKNPRKWPQLFDFRAAFVDAPRTGAQVPPVRITLPDGGTVTSEHADLGAILSKVLSRAVTLEAAERGQHEAGTASRPRPRPPKPRSIGVVQ